MTASLAQLESEISSLRNELETLKGVLAPRETAVRVPIQSLDPEPFEIASPLEAVIRPADKGYVATFFDANVNASGDTEAEAFDNLKDMLVATSRRRRLVARLSDSPVVIRILTD